MQIIDQQLTRELFDAGVNPHAAAAALVHGVVDGREVALMEAPHIYNTLGFKPDTYTVEKLPIEIGPLPYGVLGVTDIASEGKAVGMRISSSIPRMMLDIARKRKKSPEWTVDAIYLRASDTTGHEIYHAFSAPLAKGEEIDEKARDIMESITTRGRYKMKKVLGKEDDAEFVKRTNPYPGAWVMSEVADWAPYEGVAGDGYKGFLADASREPFYRPLWRLTKSATKAAWKKGIDAVSMGAPRYAPATS